MVIRRVSGFTRGTLQDAVTASQRLSIFEPCRMWQDLGREFGKSLTRLISGVMQGSGNGLRKGSRKSRKCAVAFPLRRVSGRAPGSVAELDLDWCCRRVSRRPAPPSPRGGTPRIPAGAFQNFLGCAGPPRFGATSAKRASRASDRALFDPQGGGGRYDAKGVGVCVREPLDNVHAPKPGALAWQAQGAIKSPGSRALSRSACRRADDEAARPRTSRRPVALDFTTAVERDRGTQKFDDGFGDAGLAPASTACIRFSPSRASQPAPGFALVAGAGGIVEIPTSRPLQQITADGRGIAKLCRCADRSASATAG